MTHVRNLFLLVLDLLLIDSIWKQLRKGLSLLLIVLYFISILNVELVREILYFSLDMVIQLLSILIVLCIILLVLIVQINYLHLLLLFFLLLLLNLLNILGKLLLVFKCDNLLLTVLIFSDHLYFFTIILVSLCNVLRLSYSILLVQLLLGLLMLLLVLLLLLLLLELFSLCLLLKLLQIIHLLLYIWR